MNPISVGYQKILALTATFPLHYTYPLRGRKHGKSMSPGYGKVTVKHNVYKDYTLVMMKTRA